MKNIINIFVNQPQPQVAPDQDTDLGWLTMFVM
jgi:hypothetical protein